MLKSGSIQTASSTCATTSSGVHTVKVLVGSESVEFLIPRRLLATCVYFRNQMHNPEPCRLSHPQTQLVLRLEGRCPAMFRLFEWQRKSLDKLIDDAEADSSCEELQWDLVNLHLFAANIGEEALQDVAMDGIQDVYLRRNWNLKPELVRYVYSCCNAQESYRLRKWIVAMLAWTLGADGAVGTFRDLFGECAGLWEEYNSHLNKVAASRLEVDLKNPQLRLPSNQLRSEERQFGYRQCSFHSTDISAYTSHRSKVGQGVCPHSHSHTTILISPWTDGSTETGSEDDPALELQLISPVDWI
ncbi:hypothetical protein GGR57DRAFT_496223 [Xylariaceae sp. FL1272]|nr:hypothetical protein GGR57DRAFT_496223 [Xylariaceae sp. FL1272]